MVKSKKTGKRAQKKTMTRRRKADNISRQTSEPLAGLEAPDRTAGKPPLMKNRSRGLVAVTNLTRDF